jgi:hypothetical protein
VNTWLISRRNAENAEPAETAEVLGIYVCVLRDLCELRHLSVLRVVRSARAGQRRSAAADCTALRPASNAASSVSSDTRSLPYVARVKAVSA